ncbi:UNVERIFIED_CONTAM: hypothetical protein PYX00_000742 [Menopon gallinae]|uniref:Gamma-glutamylcyclotransferase family protein n=1 Tax=Menopon gallinae TaxID=328185 RepID=A0AAW2IB64_9NEOP
MRFARILFSPKNMTSNHYVFVYGTLKKGEPNHDWLSSKNGFSKFISPAETAKKYPLIIASRYNIPFLLYSPGDGENVKGEVYEVDDKMLAALDILEDHPSFYIREVEKVNLNSTDTLDCWIYFIKNFKPELLTQERFKEYHSNGDHGKPYADRKFRDPGYHARTDILTG